MVKIKEPITENKITKPASNSSKRANYDTIKQNVHIQDPKLLLQQVARSRINIDEDDLKYLLLYLEGKSRHSAMSIKQAQLIARYTLLEVRASNLFAEEEQSCFGEITHNPIQIRDLIRNDPIAKLRSLCRQQQLVQFLEHILLESLDTTQADFDALHALC